MWYYKRNKLHVLIVIQNELKNHISLSQSKFKRNFDVTCHFSSADYHKLVNWNALNSTLNTLSTDCTNGMEANKIWHDCEWIKYLSSIIYRLKVCD